MDICYAKSVEAITFPVHGGFSVHSLENDEYFLLEEGVSSVIWDKLDGSRTVREIICEIADQFREPADSIQSDVVQFIECLLENKLIVEIKERK